MINAENDNKRYCPSCGRIHFIEKDTIMIQCKCGELVYSRRLEYE